MGDTERTIALLKPGIACGYLVSDGINGSSSLSQGVAAHKIISHIESEGFRIVEKKCVNFTRAEICRLYPSLRNKPFFEELADYMVSGHCLALLLERQSAIEHLRLMIGPTDPKEAVLACEESKLPRSSWTIRADFGSSIIKNAIHASSSKHSFIHERSVIFPQNFVAMEQGIVVLKPDAVLSGNSDKIIQVIVENGCFLLTKVNRLLSHGSDIELLYGTIKDKKILEEIEAAHSKNQCVILRVCGLNCKSKLEVMMGPPSVSEAKSRFPNTIRSLYGMDNTKNAVQYFLNEKRMSEVEKKWNLPEANHNSQRTLGIFKLISPPTEMLARISAALQEKVEEAGFLVVAQTELNNHSRPLRRLFRDHEEVQARCRYMSMVVSHDEAISYFQFLKETKYFQTTLPTEIKRDLKLEIYTSSSNEAYADDIEALRITSKVSHGEIIDLGITTEHMVKNIKASSNFIDQSVSQPLHAFILRGLHELGLCNPKPYTSNEACKWLADWMRATNPRKKTPLSSESILASKSWEGSGAQMVKESVLPSLFDKVKLVWPENDIGNTDYLCGELASAIGASRLNIRTVIESKNTEQEKIEAIVRSLKRCGTNIVILEDFPMSLSLYAALAKEIGEALFAVQVNEDSVDESKSSEPDSRPLIQFFDKIGACLKIQRKAHEKENISYIKTLLQSKFLVLHSQEMSKSTTNALRRVCQDLNYKLLQWKGNYANESEGNHSHEALRHIMSEIERSLGKRFLIHGLPPDVDVANELRARVGQPISVLNYTQDSKKISRVMKFYLNTNMVRSRVSQLGSSSSEENILSALENDLHNCIGCVSYIQETNKPFTQENHDQINETKKVIRNTSRCCNYKYLSVKDLLRAEIITTSSLGASIEMSLAEKNTVDVTLVIKVIKKRLDLLGNSTKFLLDEFPFTEEYFAEFQREFGYLPKFIIVVSNFSSLEMMESDTCSPLLERFSRNGVLKWVHLRPQSSWGPFSSNLSNLRKNLCRWLRPYKLVSVYFPTEENSMDKTDDTKKQGLSPRIGKKQFRLIPKNEVLNRIETFVSNTSYKTINIFKVLEQVGSSLSSTKTAECHEIALLIAERIEAMNSSRVALIGFPRNEEEAVYFQSKLGYVVDKMIYLHPNKIRTNSNEEQAFEDGEFYDSDEETEESMHLRKLGVFSMPKQLQNLGVFFATNPMRMDQEGFKKVSFDDLESVQKPLRDVLSPSVVLIFSEAPRHHERIISLLSGSYPINYICSSDGNTLSPAEIKDRICVASSLPNCSDFILVDGYPRIKNNSTPYTLEQMNAISSLLGPIRTIVSIRFEQRDKILSDDEWGEYQDEIRPVMNFLEKDETTSLSFPPTNVVNIPPHGTSGPSAKKDLNKSLVNALLQMQPWSTFKHWQR